MPFPACFFRLDRFHRVNASIREALIKSKEALIQSETLVQSLDRLDLTNVQKRDQRFYPPESLIVFNQKVRDAEPGNTGKLAGILSGGVLVEVEGRFVTVQNRLLDRISVCLLHRGRKVVDALPHFPEEGRHILHQLLVPYRMEGIRLGNCV